MSFILGMVATLVAGWIVWAAVKAANPHSRIIISSEGAGNPRFRWLLRREGRTLAMSTGSFATYEGAVAAAKRVRKVMRGNCVVIDQSLGLGN